MKERREHSVATRKVTLGHQQRKTREEQYAVKTRTLALCGQQSENRAFRSERSGRVRTAWPGSRENSKQIASGLSASAKNERHNATQFQLQGPPLPLSVGQSKQHAPIKS
jgi:hypothetical protein